MIRSTQAKGPSVSSGSGGGGGSPPIPGPYTAWKKFSVVHTQFQTGALTNSIELYQLPAMGVLHGALLKPTTLFLGGGITSYKLALGLAGNTQRYMNSNNVFSGPVASDFFYLSEVMDSRDFSAVTSLKITATSIGANLSASTQGAADIWLLISLLP